MASQVQSSYRMGLRLNVHTHVGRSKIDAVGLFCVLDMPKGLVFGEYDGRRIDPTKFKLPVDSKTYYWQLTSGLVIDGAEDGNNTRFLNHSCNPNCEGHEYETEQGLRVLFRTIRPVRIGAELTIDYNLGYPDGATPAELRAAKKELTCRCGSKSCRGHMMDPDLFKRSK